MTLQTKILIASVYGMLYLLSLTITVFLAYFRMHDEQLSPAKRYSLMGIAVAMAWGVTAVISGYVMMPISTFIVSISLNVKWMRSDVRNRIYEVFAEDLKRISSRKKDHGHITNHDKRRDA